MDYEKYQQYICWDQLRAKREYDAAEQKPPNKMYTIGQILFINHGWLLEQIRKGRPSQKNKIN